METIIELRGLRKTYGSFVAVNGLDLTVNKGDVYGFLGPNGAGKSTTIRMMLSLIQPTAGTIKLFGEPLSTHRNQILRRIGAIVERPDFYNYLTAEKNLKLLGRLSGADISTKNIHKVLDLVGLLSRENSKVKTFSHGMKQRLGIAQALLHDPQLIVLDEPTTGLDPQGMVDVRSIIRDLATSHNKTVVLSSHILPEVELTASRMIIINNGKTIVEGSVQELLNSGKLKVTIETRDVQGALRALNETRYANDIRSTGEQAVILSVNQNDVSGLAEVLVNARIAIDAIIPVRSLEEYFISITQEAQ